MKQFFEKALHHLGKQEKTFVLNIGAMDGVMFDELNGYTTKYEFDGLYVEPIPYLYEKLIYNLGRNKNNIFENSAISDYDGEIEMMVIDRKPIDDGIIHPCFYGMSAVYPPKNGLGSEGDKEIVEKYGQIVKVPCITFETLLKKHGITSFDVVKIDAEGHDYNIFKQIDLKKYRPKVVRLEHSSMDKGIIEEIKNIFNHNGYVVEMEISDMVAITKELHDILYNKSTNKNSNVTIVTGIWNINRDSLTDGWSREFEHYMFHLEKLMKSDDNMIIYIEERYRHFVEQHRKKENTLIIVRELEWFRGNSFIYNKIQEIRNNPDWYNQSGWLVDSTQAKLEMYNPIVMSKFFLLHDATIFDPFDSTHFIWIDGALTNTVHEGYFWKDKVIRKLDKYFNDFGFVYFPYDGKVEIHGFRYKEICGYAGQEVNKVVRGGIFGGSKESICELNSIYYDLLTETLSRGLMGTEESIFTILMYKYPELFSCYGIDKNGLLGTFFENLKNDTLKKEQPKIHFNEKDELDINNVGLYVITFNSPKQFETLIKSMLNYDKDFIEKTKKFVLDNSTDLSTTPSYIELCEKYGFEHIKKDNLGICGGRQFIAEHFDESGLDYMWFSEDDMFFQNKPGEFCKNGFARYIPNLFKKSMDIIKKEGFDFLKINYTEFFGDNGTQWSWYNLPVEVRLKLFPDYPKLPEKGLGNPPKTIFNNIKSYKGLPYVDGEIYYCNWTQVLSKTGNKKMFLDTKFQFPFEQTWMSYIYQQTKKGEIKPGLLLITPIEHNRFDHYNANLRKES